jgi:Fic family protein
MDRYEPYPVYDPMRERAVALQRALLVLDNLPRGALDLDALVRLHRMLLSQNHPGCGQLRDGPGVIRLRGTVVQELPAPREAREMATRAMRWLDESLRRESETLDSSFIAAEIVFMLLQAHPFIDGNGRVARAVGTWVLLRAGYELLFDLRLYCRERAKACYRAIAARQQCGSTPSDPEPWRTFFGNMLGYCFRPPA